MPIVSGIFSNRYNDPEDYEEFIGAESFPYVILRESQEPEEWITEPNKQPVSFFERIVTMMKFQNVIKPQF